MTINLSETWCSPAFLEKIALNVSVKYILTPKDLAKIKQVQKIIESFPDISDIRMYVGTVELYDENGEILKWNYHKTLTIVDEDMFYLNIAGANGEEFDTGYVLIESLK